jgi:hypothetical protein
MTGRPDQCMGLHHKASLINRLDDTTRGPAAPSTIVNLALRAVGIGLLVDEERTPILIKDAERAGRQGAPTGERAQDSIPPVHLDVDQVAGMEGVVTVTRPGCHPLWDNSQLKGLLTVSCSQPAACSRL